MPHLQDFNSLPKTIVTYRNNEKYQIWINVISTIIKIWSINSFSINNYIYKIIKYNHFVNSSNASIYELHKLEELF